MFVYVVQQKQYGKYGRMHEQKKLCLFLNISIHVSRYTLDVNLFLLNFRIHNKLYFQFYIILGNNNNVYYL